MGQPEERGAHRRTASNRCSVPRLAGNFRQGWSQTLGSRRVLPMGSSSPLVRQRFDQLAKRILRAIYARVGIVTNQHEVAAEAQEIDTLLRLSPSVTAELERIGLLGRMIDSSSTIFEAFHEAPSVDDYRDCLRKQLVADHLDVLEARTKEKDRPAFPRMWILSAGRPESVILGYGLLPMPSFPSAFLEGQEEERVGVVVLRELPRTRETLLLRVLGAGDVLKDALAELARLPEDAWERQVAMPSVLALRIEIPQDSTDGEEREYLMSSMELFEQWERQVRSEAREQGAKSAAHTVKKALDKLYRARFGATPPVIQAAIEAMDDAETLDRWLDLFEVKSVEEINAALTVH